jgi:predicted secreted protein
MSWQLALAIFFVAWWVSFLAVLPWGVKTSQESGEALIPGQADSAPARPMFLRKIAATTIIAFVITLLAWANAHYGWVTFASLPGPDRL